MVDVVTRPIRRVFWTVVPLADAAIVRSCRRCGVRREFHSSGKIRANARGRRLDVWRIHRCAACGERWNERLHHRATVADLGPDRLRAYERNEAPGSPASAAPDGSAVPPQAAGTAAPCATASAEEQASKGSAAPRFRVEGDRVSPSQPDIVEVQILVPGPCAARLDAVVAAGLGATRAAVARWWRQGVTLATGEPSRPSRLARDGDLLRLALPLKG